MAREKIFGAAPGVPLDRNAKVRVAVYANSCRLTRATMAVFTALLWTFHNSRTGQCFPSYEAIATAAKCDRDTVHQAIGALEAAKVLTWIHRLARVGRRVLRTSNAYAFRDPLPCGTGRPPGLRWLYKAKSENPTGTRNQKISYTCTDPPDPPPREVAAAQSALASVAVRMRERLLGKGPPDRSAEVGPAPRR